MMARRTGGRAIVWLVLLAVAAPAAGAMTEAQRRQVLDEAQAAYDLGVSVLRTDREGATAAFRRAAERFGQLVDDGVVNGWLEYNLANAYFQAGELGRAILHYRQAARLLPGDAKIEHNLESARALRRSGIAPTGRRAVAEALLGWHRGRSTRARFVVFAVAWGIFWLALMVNLFRPAAPWRYVAGSAAVVGAVLAASVGSDLLVDRSGRGGVVLADDVVVRKGNGEGFEPQFAEPLHQGTEFEVRDRRPGWLRIELPDGKTGWIRAGQAGLVR